MSLRARLLAAVALALLVSFAAGALLATWHDARLVRDEVAAALATSRADATLAIGEAAGQAQPAGLLGHFVASFDGSRHVAVSLWDAGGRKVAASSVATPRSAAPAWFAGLVDPRLKQVVLPLPAASGLSALRLVPDARGEIGERWSETRDRLTLLALLSVLTGVLCSTILRVGLAPLLVLGAGLDRLGAGERPVQLARAGPPEIAALADAFNRLAGLLTTAEDRNSRLQYQLQRVAEEERLDIARDLHDEVGPLLFAITTHTATIGRLAEAGAVQEITPPLLAIRQSVGILQDAVRAMLHRLREDEVPPDLPCALQGLVGFWRQLRPETRFELVVPAQVPKLPMGPHMALLRVAQEGISNAVRHAAPQTVRVELGCGDGGVTLRVADDGHGAAAGSGYGLPGLRERLEAVGGRLEVTTAPSWTLTATAPGA